MQDTYRVVELEEAASFWELMEREMISSEGGVWLASAIDDTADEMEKAK